MFYIYQIKIDSNGIRTIEPNVQKKCKRGERINPNNGRYMSNLQWFNLIICLSSPIVDMLALEGTFDQLVIQWTKNQSTYNDLKIIGQLEIFDL